MSAWKVEPQSLTTLYSHVTPETGAALGATLGSTLGATEGATLGSTLGATEGATLGSTLGVTGASDGCVLSRPKIPNAADTKL